MLKYKEIPKYPYSKKFEKISFGTFLKHETLSHPSMQTWTQFENYFKQEMNLKSLAFAQQVHKNDIWFLDDEVSPKVCQFDAIITQNKRVALLGFHADCQIVFFFDPIKEVIAIAHAGFRGQILSVYTRVIEGMKKRYQSDPTNIYAVMSFSLCQKHAEFVNFQNEFPKKLWCYRDERNYFDLKKMALDELLQSGIRRENITMNQDCNFEQNQLFYSYRAEKTIKRHISYIFLN